MKKLVIYILLLTIVFSVTACSDPYGLYTIDDVDALKEEVDAAWGRETFWMDYYVSCNGYHIIAYPSDIMAEGNCYKHIAGYEFVCFSYFYLKAYKDGELIGLEKAYESGLVSKKAIAKAAERNQLEFAKYNEERRIRREFHNRYGEYNKFRFYGDENGRHILFIKTATAMGPLEVKQIAGSEFRHMGPFSLYAYIDGEFIDLEEAYEKGLISTEAIAAALKEHTKYGLD